MPRRTETYVERRTRKRHRIRYAKKLRREEARKSHRKTLDTL